MLFSCFLGFLISNKFEIQKKNNASQEEEITRKNFNYQFINPILECDVDISLNNQLSSLKSSTRDIIDQEKNNQNITFAAVYFRDLNNGPWLGINEDEYFSPASLIKLPTLMTYLKKADINPSILQQKLTVKIDSNSGSDIQNIKPSESLQNNQEYPIEELLRRMIVESDNDAYNTLIDNLSPEETYKIFKDLDIDISKAFSNPNGDIITVQEYASFYRILYNASYLSQEMSEKALSLLSQTEYQNGLVAGIPKNITISHKFGERKFTETQETQLHDCGIVYAPKKPYLLCIMTRGKDITKEATTIKKISQHIYQTIINQ